MDSKHLEFIRYAMSTLTSHSEGDFVSKAQAKECVHKLQQVLDTRNGTIPSNQEVIVKIITEIERAEKKHPDWPSDMVYAATIVSEENGELTRACLQYESEGGDLIEVEKEAIQTAATCIRLLTNLPKS